jgi:hypothetical protein
MPEYAAHFPSQEPIDPISLAAQDRRVCLRAELRWVFREYRHGKPVLRRELLRLAVLTDDAGGRTERRS